jgi:tRNA nucleotidyltransferase/poly(A) polymerase
MNSTLLTKALQEFAPLALEQKKGKILEMLQAFGTAHPIFGELQQDIQSKIYSDTHLVKIYKIILESINNLQHNHREESLSQLEQLHHILQELRAKEAAFLQKEGNIDQWLDQALSLV